MASIRVPYSANPQYVVLHCNELTMLILVQNRIQESLLQFASDCLNANLRAATIILLFTHLDLFEAKLRKKIFKDNFPDYRGRQDDSFAAREFIAQKFRGVCNGMTIAETFFTNATDTKEFPAILSNIEDLIKTRWRGEQFYVTGSDDQNSSSAYSLTSMRVIP